MKLRTLRFARPQDVTESGYDGTTIRFPFLMVDSNLLGRPEESQQTTEHTLEVSITRTRRGTWSLDEDGLTRVLFEIGRRWLTGEMQKRKIDELERYEISTSTHDSQCPFDPQKIDDPEGLTVEIEVRKEIGF